MVGQLDDDDDGQLKRDQLERWIDEEKDKGQLIMSQFILIFIVINIIISLVNNYLHYQQSLSLFND